MPKKNRFVIRDFFKARIENHIWNLDPQTKKEFYFCTSIPKIWLSTVLLYVTIPNIYLPELFPGNRPATLLW